MVEGKDQGDLWRHATHVSIRSDTCSRPCSPRKKARKHQVVIGPAPGYLRSNLKRGLSATSHLLAMFMLLYLGAWGYWVALYRETPSRKCSARLDGLPVDANLRQLNLARRALYDSLEARLKSEGLNIGKEQTQGLDSRSLFRIRDGRVEPGLQPLAVPVRSIVIPLRGGEARERLASAVRDYILPIAAEAGIWLQDPKKYHSTVFHASPHQHPIKASTAEVAVEMTSVRKAAMMLCPLEIALERITVTATGNIIACWQMAGGSDPSEVRRTLERALPNAPQHAYQTIQDPAILHTTLARLLKPTRAMLQDQVAGRMLRGGEADQVATLQSAVGRMTEALCGLRLTLRALWYVQEDDLLALALNGRSRQQEVPLLCQDPPPALTSNVKPVHHAPPVIKDAGYLE